MPCFLEEKALLGIHGGSFPRSDSEERAIEVANAGDEGAVTDRAVYAGRRIGVEGTFGIPPLLRHCADGVAALAQQLPEFFEARGSGEPARGADDRDRLHFSQFLS